jgi:hypothetical protein
VVYPGVARREQTSTLRVDNFTGDLHPKHTPSVGVIGDEYY